MAGEQALEQLAGELAGLGARRPLLLTDKGVSGTGLATLLAGVLAEGSCRWPPSGTDPGDSSTAVVERIAARHRELGCDSLVALGGGSVIDTAKAVNILASMGDAAAGLRRRRLPDQYATTAGGGAHHGGHRLGSDPGSGDQDEASGRKVPFTSPSCCPSWRCWIRASPRGCRSTSPPPPPWTP